MLVLNQIYRQTGRSEGRTQIVSTIRLYHNPKCSKSRGALDLLHQREANVEVIEYLKTPADRPQLEEILQKTQEAPSALLRIDKNFHNLGLDADLYSSRESIISLLLEHPSLMQRPIAVTDTQGVIARPSERVLELLD